jgi:hypothetical protein
MLIRVDVVSSDATTQRDLFGYDALLVGVGCEKFFVGAIE